MKKRMIKAIDAAAALRLAGITYFVLSLLSAVALVISAFTGTFGGPNWAFVGVAVGVAVSGWLVQAFSAAVAAHIDVANAIAYENYVPSTPPAQ